jgi:predicted negative regulator of RcsB-dependent stress response
MQSQDVSAEFLIKFWPWLEANRKRLIGAAVAAGVILLIWYFVATERAQKAVDAGQAYTQLQLNLPPNPAAPQAADAFLNLAGKYSGTLAAARAQLQAAAVLFSAGHYADAQALFQKLLEANSGGALAAAAQFGVAASLEAQNKLDAAATGYRAVTTGYPESTEVLPAKFSLGRVLELQGKLADAASYYTEVAHSQMAGSLGAEAARRLSQIQAKLAAIKPAGKS